MLSNKEIAARFHLLGKLSDLHGENPFKGRSYANAAFRIERLPQPLSRMSPDAIERTDGIGKAIYEKIQALLSGGDIPALVALLEKTPPGVLDIMTIQGLGPKKVRTIWKEMGVESVGELLYACHENRLSHYKGFGAKTQDQVRAAIEFMQQSRGKFHYATAEIAAQIVADHILSTGLAHRISFTGPLRRCCEIIEVADLLVSADPAGGLQAALTPVFQPDTENTRLWKGPGAGNVPVHIHFTDEKHWFHDLFVTTGPPEHVKNFSPEPDAPSEESIYGNGPFCIPELRDLDPVEAPSPSAILRESDLKGILHVHSAWSDGMNTLEEMAVQCRNLGYEYLGICDHSQSAFYANGLKPDRIRKQHEEIDVLNEKLAPFRIFKGIECDILNDGSLDYETPVLASFDFIVASIHSPLKMDREKATKRVLAAVRNPYTTILGHMTGRLLLSREGYPLDHERIIEACREHNVVIELNAHPYRLDIDWRWIPQCMEAGVMISVNPDAHHIGGLEDVHYGCLAGRKGGLLRERTFNVKGVAEVEALFEKKKAGRIKAIEQ